MPNKSLQDNAEYAGSFFTVAGRFGYHFFSFGSGRVPELWPLGIYNHETWRHTFHWSLRCWRGTLGANAFDGFCPRARYTGDAVWTRHHHRVGLDHFRYHLCS